MSPVLYFYLPMVTFVAGMVALFGYMAWSEYQFSKEEYEVVDELVN